MERGHTCPRRQYRAFLRRCLRPSSPQAGSGAPSLWDDDNEDCADDDDDDGVLEEGWWTTAEEEGRGGGLPSRPWEGLRLRVERGVR